ncbi:MAG: phosphoribosyltransferase family protein [Bacteriovoracaceae bacterium]
MIFKNRSDGGKKLGEFLLSKNIENPLVIGLPRGGVVTAKEVAQILKCPLEIVIVRKIGSPQDPEYGIGAMSEDEECFFGPGADFFDIHGTEVQQIVEEERQELRRRIKQYRGRELMDMKDKTLIVVDDGLATGVTASAAIKFLKKKRPQRIIFAVPVGPRLVRHYLKELCDEIIVLEKPDHFLGVGNWYDEFEQTSDEEVIELMKYRGDVT